VTIEWVLVRVARGGLVEQGPADVKNVRVMSIGDMAAGEADSTRAGTASERLLVSTGPACGAGLGTARNVGLARATGDYIVFLASDTVVTEDWVSVAQTMAIQGVGWRCRTIEMASKIDVAKPVRVGTMKDRQRPVPATTIDSTCWGAPANAFAAVFGFDAAFDSGDGCHDLEAAIRMSRTGVVFVTLSHAAVIRRRPSKPQPKEASGGTQNKSLLTKLTRERRRTVPLSISTATDKTSISEAAPGADVEDPEAGPSLDEALHGDLASDDTFAAASDAVGTIASLEFTLDDTVQAARVRQRADAPASDLPGAAGDRNDVRSATAFDLTVLDVGELEPVPLDADDIDTVDLMPARRRTDV
jgi:hypothetical protein